MLLILHIEDDLNDHRLLVMGLKKHNPDLRFDLAVNSEEALQLLAETEFDCIICDFQVPGLSGVEFIKNLRFRGDTTPLILYTGAGNEKIAAEAFRMGADDYFSKSEEFAIYERMNNSIQNTIRSHQIRIAQEQTERRFNVITQSSAILIYEWDIATDRLEWFGAFKDVLGYSNAEKPEKMRDWYALINAEDAEKLKHSYSVNSPSGRPVKESYRVMGKNGNWVYLDDRSRPVFDEAGKLISWIGVCYDISEQVKARTYQQRLNRAYSLLAGVNHIAGLTNNERSFLEKLADLMHQKGQYRFVWIGYKQDDESHRVKLMASAGHGQGYLDSISVSWNQDQEGSGPTGTAMKTGRPQQASYLVTNTDNELWRREALRRGFTLGIALPLIVEEETIGTVNLYSAEQDELTEAEMTLLEDVAQDAGLAISSIRQKAENQRIQQELHVSESLLRETEAMAGVGSYRWNLTTGSLIWSQNLFKIYGYEPNAVQPTLALHRNHVHHEDLKILESYEIEDISPGDSFEVEYRIQGADGTEKSIQDSARVRLDEQNGQPVMIGFVTVLNK